MRRHILTLLLLCLLFGCNDTRDDPSHPHFSSGLDANRQVNSLSEPELASFCMELNDWSRDLIGENELRRLSCLLEAIDATLSFGSNGSPSLDVTACETATAQCLVDGPASMRLTCTQAELQADVAQCTVTVAEYEACTSALFTASAERASRTSCAQFAAEIANPPPGDPEQALLADFPECERAVLRRVAVRIRGSLEHHSGRALARRPVRPRSSGEAWIEYDRVMLRGPRT
jgi:hypothetical protein